MAEPGSTSDTPFALPMRVPPLAVLFGGVALAFLALVLGGVDAALEARGAEAEAEVTEVVGTAISDRASVRYRFLVDGEPVTGEDGGINARVGQTVKVEYLPSMPVVNRLAIKGGRASGIALWAGLAAAALLMIVGGRWWRRLARRKALVDELGERGERATGRAVEVDVTRRVLKYAYPTPDGAERQSEAVAVERDALAGLEHGSPLAVLFDPDQPERSVWAGEAKANI